MIIIMLIVVVYSQSAIRSVAWFYLEVLRPVLPIYGGLQRIQSEQTG